MCPPSLSVGDEPLGSVPAIPERGSLHDSPTFRCLQPWPQSVMHVAQPRETRPPQPQGLFSFGRDQQNELLGSELWVCAGSTSAAFHLGLVCVCVHARVRAKLPLQLQSFAQ